MNLEYFRADYENPMLSLVFRPYVVIAAESVIVWLDASDYSYPAIQKLEYKGTSNTNLFVYGVDEETAIKRLEVVEETIRDNLLWGTVCVRTKDAITIVSQRLNRSVRINLRLHSSIGQILYGYNCDIDCVGVAYDGQQTRLSVVHGARMNNSFKSTETAALKSST
ncbi:hypothetical protein TWF173_011378 [Orbilia oligospora]|nr:hypothetical protein TWF173_011378 [Orbilia oligospora]